MVGPELGDAVDAFSAVAAVVGSTGSVSSLLDVLDDDFGSWSKAEEYREF